SAVPAPASSVVYALSLHDALPIWKLEQLGRVVDEVGVHVAGEEPGVADDVQQERDVGLHPADAELLEHPAHLGGRRLERQPPGRSEEHTSELQSRENLVCRLLLEK